LQWAVYSEWQEIVEMLINTGSKLDSIDSFGYSPFMLAIYLEQASIVEMLIKAGASTKNLKQVNLIKAIEHKDEDKVLLLLSEKVDPNCCNYLGEKALKIAITTEQVNICRMLIQFGADTEFIDIEHKESLISNFIDT